MLLLTVLFSLLLLRIWGSGKPVQKDGWFMVTQEFFQQYRFLTSKQCGVILASIIASLLFFSFIHSVLESISGWFAALFAVLVLIYCYGRGDWAACARQYISAWHRKNWQAGAEAAQQVGVDTYEIAPEDWLELNHRVVMALAYQGFERLFVILFWYCIGGILPILAYRLIAISRDETEDPAEEEQLTRILWLFEWPVVRVFGMSLAITGNFNSCFARVSDFFFDTRKSTQHTLVNFVEASLAVEEQEIQDPRCGERELREILHLYSRTTILWVCVIALLTLFF